MGRSSVYGMSSSNGHINKNIHNVFLNRGIITRSNIIHGCNGQWQMEHQVPEIHVPIDIIEWHNIVYAEEKVAGTSDPFLVPILWLEEKATQERQPWHDHVLFNKPPEVACSWNASTEYNIHDHLSEAIQVLLWKNFFNQMQN